MTAYVLTSQLMQSVLCELFNKLDFSFSQENTPLFSYPVIKDAVDEHELTYTYRNKFNTL